MYPTKPVQWQGGGGMGISAFQDRSLACWTEQLMCQGGEALGSLWLAQKSLGWAGAGRPTQEGMQAGTGHGRDRAQHPWKQGRRWLQQLAWHLSPAITRAGGDP